MVQNFFPPITMKLTRIVSIVCLSTVLNFQVKKLTGRSSFYAYTAKKNYLLVTELVTQILRLISWLVIVVLTQELQPNTNKSLLHANIMICD